MMYLHIGNGKTVRVRDLISFFDFDSMTVAGQSRRFLSECEKKNLIDDCTGGEIPRSVILLANGKKKGESPSYRILFSLLSTAALRARLESDWNET